MEDRVYQGGEKMNGVDWSYFERFGHVNGRYLPDYGQGETKATQIVTAVNKLVYKWYNDGDVFDNEFSMHGWCNDLSSYANWLYEHTDAKDVLARICDCKSDAEYEHLLKDLADMLLDDEDIENENSEPKIGDIYDCDGPFRFVYEDEDDEEEDEI